MQDLEDRLDQLPRLEQKLERFQAAGLEDRLREQSALVREEKVLESISDRTQEVRDAAEALDDALPMDTFFLSPKALKDLPGASILSDAKDMLEQLNRELDEVKRQLDEALAGAEQGLENIRKRWSVHKKEVEDKYHSILREMQTSQESAVDGEEFIRLRRDIERLRPMQYNLEMLKATLTDYHDRRSRFLEEWEDVKDEEFRRLSKAARKVSKALKGRVQAEVFRAGDRQLLFDLLTREIGGRLHETIETLKSAPEVSIPEFVSMCRQGADKLQEKYNFPRRQAEKLSGASSSVLMQIEELELPTTTVLKLNTVRSGAKQEWRSLHQLSKGQKATAILLILLLESDAPLVIDQPEDDLDNRFITDEIVPRIRKHKRRRQFVFSTHNANIPVLGDSELILGLDASTQGSDESAFIASEHRGSIDLPSVKVLVEEVLEGGKSAFEKRRRKYGF